MSICRANSCTVPLMQLRQLHRIRCSLDDDSVATLVHAFVASRVDYCGSLMIGTPRKTTDKLQRVLNSAAWIFSNTRKFDRGLTHFRQSQLHWLDVVDRVRFRVCVQVFRCLHKMAPEYLSTYCQVPTRLWHLWPSPPAIGWPWSSRFPTCETCLVRRMFICIRRPFELELTFCLP